MIDPDYKELVEAKVVEVFGERNLENVYSMIEDVLEDEKMVCYALYFLLTISTATVGGSRMIVNHAAKQS